MPGSSSTSWSGYSGSANHQWTNTTSAWPPVFRSLRIFMPCHGIASFCYTYIWLGFSGSFLNFTIYKTTKSSRCKLTFMIIMTWMTWCVWMILIWTNILLTTSCVVSQWHHAARNRQCETESDYWVLIIDQWCTAYQFSWSISVVLNGFHHMSWPRSRKLQRLGLVSNPQSLVSVSSQTKCPTSQSRPERSRVHPRLIQQCLLAAELGYLGIIAPRNFAEFHKLCSRIWQNLLWKNSGTAHQQSTRKLTDEKHTTTITCMHSFCVCLCFTCTCALFSHTM